jgi:tryptophanyl-tRNA synthetase
MVNTECRRAGIGCFDCKKRVAEAMTRRIEPVRERIEANLAQPELIQEVLRTGSDRARAVAAETMADVRSAMKMPTL